MFSDPSIVTAPKTEISMPSVDVEFTFTQDTFNQIEGVCCLGVPDVVLKGTAGGTIDLTVTDRKNDTSNDFSITVGENAPSDFTYFFKVENLKLLSGDYKVEVSQKGISHFTNVNKPVEYFIALEKRVNQKEYIMNDVMLWVEKYRPSKISECILTDDLKTTFQTFVDEGHIPNLLLSVVGR